MLRHPKYANDPNLQHAVNRNMHFLTQYSTALHLQFNLIPELETILSYCSIIVYKQWKKNE